VPLFGRRRPPISPLAASEPGKDWSRLEEIQHEWPRSALNAEEDLQAWRNGQQLYNDRDDYHSLMRAGGLQARALQHELYGRGILCGTDLPNTVHQVLFASTVTPPDGRTLSEQAAKRIRLALTVIKKYGWQLESHGGNGLFREMIERSRLLLGSAVAAHDTRPWEGDLKLFFESHPIHLADEPAVHPAAPATTQHDRKVIDRILATIDAADRGDAVSELRVKGMAAQHVGDLAAALPFYEQAAQRGDVDAAFDAGCVSDELGNARSSLYWWEAAAERGHAGAAYNRAVAAYRDSDLSTAAQWYERAARLGDGAGYAALTQLADEAGDEAAERRWAELGADAGHPFCLERHSYYIALSASEGDGVALRRALTYAQRSAELGNSGGMYRAGLVSLQLGNRSEAKLWFERAQEAGDPEASEMIRKYGL
jgi:tetratricopeptide (TPR) repeat protein